ncbi:signal peptidase II [Demequina aurantiaca]|uniref:signal peptidase II n=1 Tax=Demequina aurantiaca TaxID=676200 RepID=UPI00078489F6|nr:signal peptidase II [Demequina aurantiaca]
MTWRPALWLVAGGVVLADQLSKQWVLNNLVPGELHPVLGDWLGIELVFNSGAAFSFGNSTTWLLTIVAIIVSVAIVYYARRAQTTAAVWIFGVGLGGAIGNLIDRLFRAPSFGQGHVVDFINYNGWFVGNIADIAIVGAAIVVVLMGILGKNLLAPASSDTDETSTNADAAAGSDALGAGDSTSPEARPSE